MTLYESSYFGLRVRIPEGWHVRLSPDDSMDEFATFAAAWKPNDPPSICFAATKSLVYASLFAPGSEYVSDATIDFQACVQTDDCMMHADGRERLKKWNLNGIQVHFQDKVLDYPPENRYFRFPRWKISNNLWFYASISATGKARFDYALSVFETLTPLNVRLERKGKPLYDREPWNVPPSLFRMCKTIREGAPLFDIALELPMTLEEHARRQCMLAGRPGVSQQEWVPIAFRRKSRTRVSDCYHGPRGGLISPGIFSSRAIELLQPYMNSSICLLPCTVNGKLHYFLRHGEGASCLDGKNSQIKRFDDGGIMKIDRYRFKKNLVRDPLIFAIPEAPGEVFSTASIPKIAGKSGLTGIAFHPIDGNGREYTFPAIVGANDKR